MNRTALEPWIRDKIGAGPAGFTRQAIDAWQVGKINEVLALARAKGAFYRKHLANSPDSIQNLTDLDRFPFTSAAELRRAPLQFVCGSQDEIQRVVTLQSSGTTGEPKRLYFTAEDQELTVDFFGVGMSTLTRPGDRVLILLPGATLGSVGDLLRQGLTRQGRVPVPHGPVRSPDQVLAVMDAEKIDCIVGGPTQVLGLARRWQPGRRAPGSVLLSTDYVPAAVTAILQQTWGCAVYNHYGATEMGLGGGVDCAVHAGYHLREADLYFEIVDPESGEPVPDGVYGEVVLTTLTRRGMPLIRYRIGDRARFLPGACPCGTILRRMETVSGRYDGFISVSSGADGSSRLLRLPDFDEVLFPIQGLLNFSVALVGSGGQACLEIDAQMLTDQDLSQQIRTAVQSIPGLRSMDVVVRCHHNPDEPGSLLKRTITIKRG
jgi:phenylacetate-coenzyme A ligase PaaK-like adenylate-forming protein